MATIKSYTDVSQSKVLSKILPLESADMHYCLEQRGVATGYEIGVTNFNYVKRFKGKCNIVDVQPAWSLAALLGVLQGTNISTPDPLNKIRYSCWNDYDITYADNPVDACVAMIEKLHELKML